jgi:hypothetical protein
MADKYASFTPYNYSFNAPSNFNDVNGADPNPGEPDHVTRRGNQVLMANFDTVFPSGGGSGSLFDNIWGAGGFNNIGGIANGNQQLQDFYAMSTDQYVDKYKSTTPHWLVFSNGSVTLYNKPTFWNDYPVSSSTDLSTQFAAYKNGQGMEYQFPTLNDPFFKFLQGFYEGPKSNSVTVSFSANGLGFVGWVGEQATRAQAINGATRAIRLEGSQATKFLGNVVGPGLGFVGVMASSLESAYDENGYTLGDGAKTGIGVLMLLGSLNPITAPFVAGYALADLGLQVFTGTSLTDRIGNGIDNMNGVMLEPK